MYSNLQGSSAYSDQTLRLAQRISLFNDYEEMDSDPIIGSALDIYADESTMKSEYGNVLEIKSENSNIHDILHNLFYDVLNIEFNLWPWVRNMCKYGDFYLQLDISDKYGVTNVFPMSAYDVNRIEGLDPDNPYSVKFTVEQGNTRHHAHTSTISKELENFEVAHFRLLSDSNLIPYGKSMIESGRKVWKQLSLMEDAMLIHRIMRAPEKRSFKVDIGNIPPHEIDSHMKKIITTMKKVPIVDQETGEYNLKYNMQNLTEDFFFPVRGGDSGTEVETLSGLEFNAIDDIEYLRNKMLASLRIPKAFLGYEEELNAKATLAAEDVRFARTIERIQRIVVSELTKIAIIHLYAQGYTDQDLVDFELGLTSPSTIYEQEKIELWSSKVDLASSMVDNKLLSTEFIYNQIFGFSDDDKLKMRKQVVDDQKRIYRYEAISSDGIDPASQGSSGADDFGEDGIDSRTDMYRTGDELGPEGGSLPGGQPGAGRPKEAPKYDTESSARGKDPIGKHGMKREAVYKSKRQRDDIVNSMGKLATATIGLLNEADELKDEYENEISSSNG
jgi:hypothetical protein